jgi:hypothetical protein
VRRVCRRSLPSLADCRVDTLEELSGGKLGVVCVYCNHGGFQFRAPIRVLNLGTRASPSIVYEIDTTEPLIEYGVIGSSEKESEGARAEGEQRKR